jgi:hypothetical protein
VIEKRTVRENVARAERGLSFADGPSQIAFTSRALRQPLVKGRGYADHPQAPDVDVRVEIERERASVSLAREHERAEVRQASCRVRDRVRVARRVDDRPERPVRGSLGHLGSEP